MNEAQRAWVAAHAGEVHAVEEPRERAWSTVWRVLAGEGAVWFKACASVQAYEPRLTVALAGRWPALLVEVLAHDEERGWMLLADAGESLRERGDPPAEWEGVLASYAELQRGEAAHVAEHLAAGVPDFRLATLPGKFDALFADELPLEPDDAERLRALAPRVAALCAELAAAGIPETLQHDDLHGANVFVRGAARRIIDWGDASVSHPFFTALVTFGMLGEDGVEPADPLYARLRRAYLEPWGDGLEDAFDLAFTLGSAARMLAWARQRSFIVEPDARAKFDVWYAQVLQRTLERL